MFDVRADMSNSSFEEFEKVDGKFTKIKKSNPIDFSMNSVSQPYPL